MSKEILIFGNTEIEKKKKFLTQKDSCPFKRSRYGESSGMKQDFLLHIMLPKTSVYVKSCDGQTRWMYLLIQDDDLLEKYNTIWDKVSADIKKRNLIESLSTIKNF